MSRERFLSGMRWVGLMAGAALLAWVLSARANTGLQPRPAAPIYLSRASGQAANSPYVPQTLHDLAVGAASGPYTNTAQAFSFDGDVRQLPVLPAVAHPDLPELDSGEAAPGHTPTLADPVVQPALSSPAAGPDIPTPLTSFAGLDQAHAATVWPPDTNGDVGLHDYIQTVNDQVAIYSKTTGVQLATFSLDSLFSSLTGTPCAAATAATRWPCMMRQAGRFIITDFAFVDAHASPYFQCIAASKTGDPVTGGWWLFALRADDDTHQFLADYPKLGVWPDGIYMSANMFDCTGACTGADFKGARVWALNRANLYNGTPLQAVYFDTTADFFSAAAV